MGFVQLIKSEDQRLNNPILENSFHFKYCLFPIHINHLISFPPSHTLTLLPLLLEFQLNLYSNF